MFFSPLANASCHGLVLDAEPDLVLPRNIRVIKDEKLGFNLITMAQPSKQALINWLTQNQSLLNNRKTYLIDLRQESHIFISGLPVSIYKNRNSANANLSKAKILNKEQKLVNYLKKLKQVNVSRITEKNNGYPKYGDPLFIDNAVLNTEDEIIESINNLLSLGIYYERFYIQDHSHPSLDELARILDFIESLPDKVNLIIHCRGGRGRSSLFSTLVLLSKYKNLSVDEVFMIQEDAGQKIFTKPAKTSWKESTRLLRLNFLRSFAEKRAT